jgi:rhodanese-related sulfurtransferase
MNAHEYAARRWLEIRQDFTTIVAILVLGGLIGTAVNWKLVRSAWEGEYALDQNPATSSDVGPQPVSLQEARALMGGGKALFVDARREFFYLKEHIAGAQALPLLQFDDRIGAFRQQVPQDRLLIIYCSGYGCEDSHQLALKLQAIGFKKLRVYAGGLPEWKEAGLPTEGTDLK